jgi:hypothetical protein
LSSLLQLNGKFNVPQSTLNLLQQLDDDEAITRAAITALENEIQSKKNDLVEIQITRKRCKMYLGVAVQQESALTTLGKLYEAEDAGRPRRRSLGVIKRRVLQAYDLPDGYFRTVTEATDITGLSSDQVRSATKDAKDRDELEVSELDSSAYRISGKGIARLKEDSETRHDLETPGIRSLYSLGTLLTGN